MLICETSSNNSSQNDCRICFQQQSPVVNPQRSRSHAFIMLKNPCACKGSLSYVHEACLVKWLLTRNIRTCELCQTPFVIKEEFGSLTDMLKQVVSYIITSKKRLLKVVIYAIYLYLFVKRFAFVLKYFRNYIKEIIMKKIQNLTLNASTVAMQRQVAFQ